MEEDVVELIDYLRVILKRKILIIVGVLVGIVVGVVMSLWLPVKYHSEVVIKNGKKIEPQLHYAPVSYIPIVSSEDVAKSILLEYVHNKENIGFDLEAEVVSAITGVRITVKGPDSKTEKILKELVNRVIDDHLRITEKYVRFYKSCIEMREENISEISKEISLKELALKEMKLYLNKGVGVGINADRFVPLIMMLLQGVERCDNLKSFRNDILTYQLIIDTLMANKTRLVGEIESTAIKPNMKRNVILAGVIGLTMSIFLAFLIEYLGKVSICKT